MSINTDQEALDQLYLQHFSGMYRYAVTMVNDPIVAEDMVQQVFFKILDRKESIQIQSSIKGYLYRSVNNECLNHIKHLKVRNSMKGAEHLTLVETGDTPASQLQTKELDKHIRELINQLPEQCRTVFQLSRFENLKYTQIAEQLGLSVKTVETQMSRALKKMRAGLTDYLILVLWLWINIF